MNRKDKLFAKARNNPNNISFRQFETLLTQCRWVFDHQTGSHGFGIHPKAIVFRFNQGKDKRKDIK